MDVHIKLCLQGGHVWQFRCEEDAPVLMGLVSALPGAMIDPELPPDGLIQVEAQGGDRLFLARSSLVAVEVRRADGALVSERDRRLLAPPAPLPEGLVAPAPLALLAPALSDETHRVLLDEARRFPADAPPGTVRMLDPGGWPAVTKDVEAQIARARTVLGVPDVLETHLELRLSFVGDREAVTLERRADDLLGFVCHLHAQPKAFSGGGLRLFDSRIQDGLRVPAATFRDIELDPNTLLVFPGSVVTAGLPVRAPGVPAANGLFVLSGALRPGLARE